MIADIIGVYVVTGQNKLSVHSHSTRRYRLQYLYVHTGLKIGKFALANANHY